jgi:hypothetical protein
MRTIDVVFAAAIGILLGWLILGNVVDSEHPGGSLANDNAASSLPAISAPAEQPRPVATAEVDEQIFRIFVAGNPNVWSVAVSEDD